MSIQKIKFDPQALLAHDGDEGMLGQFKKAWQSGDLELMWKAQNRFARMHALRAGHKGFEWMEKVRDKKADPKPDPKIKPIP